MVFRTRAIREFTVNDGILTSSQESLEVPFAEGWQKGPEKGKRGEWSRQARDATM